MSINLDSKIPIVIKKDKFINYVNFNATEKAYLINVAIVNMKIPEKFISDNINPNRNTNISFERQADLYDLLNSAIKKPKSDIVVFPELSIPTIWLPFMVNFSRKHQISLIFGLEHWIIKKNAHNFVVTLVPFKINKFYKACFLSIRLKNYYAPKEIKELRKNNLQVFTNPKLYHEIFNWRGNRFSVFNCFELTNIGHRSELVGKADYIAAIAWNKDINYFSNILESMTRDLHCYIIHSNTSQYGDSMIIAPKKREMMNFVRVKGGINPVLMKARLDINKLRLFHENENNDINDEFKPLPAGFKRK